MSSEKHKEDAKRLAPGVCFPWEDKVKEYGKITGDPDMIKQDWESIDIAAYMYLWFWVHR